MRFKIRGHRGSYPNTTHETDNIVQWRFRVVAIPTRVRVVVIPSTLSSNQIQIVSPTFIYCVVGRSLPGSLTRAGEGGKNFRWLSITIRKPHSAETEPKMVLIKQQKITNYQKSNNQSISISSISKFHSVGIHTSREILVHVDSLIFILNLSKYFEW